MEDKESIGYTIIEPSIYEKLDWDMDLIIACLEVIRQNFPLRFPQFPKSLEYKILPFNNPHGDPYPVIGIQAKKEEDLNKLPNLFQIYDLLDQWIEEIAIEELKAQTRQFGVPSWEKLLIDRVYP